MKNPVPRHLVARLEQSLKQFPAVVLLGARQVGKTTLAAELAKKHGNALRLDLERPSDLNKMSDPEAFLESHRDKLVILDEVQRLPELFSVLRPLIDADRRGGRFLLLGSASPELLRQSSESLAGRVEYLELGPFSLAEVAQRAKTWRTHWLRGGFPDSFLAVDGAASLRWREAFISSHLERDVPGFGIRVPSATLRRFWTMAAHLQGQTWNASRLATSMQVSAKTVTHYLDILESTFMLRRLAPLGANVGKRLVSSPKIYFRDSGLLHALLAIQDSDSLLANPVAGPSFEGWALEQVLDRAEGRCQAWFYRTQAGAEIDLVLDRGGSGGLVAVEIKLSSAPQPSKGFWIALRDLKPKHAFIVAPVKEAYVLKEGVRVIPPHSLEEIFTDFEARRQRPLTWDP